MSSYEDKKKALFDCLTSAEQSIRGTSLEQKQIDRNDSTQRNYTQGIVSKRFHGRESIFKRPAAPIDKCLRPRRVPDYQTNPHKWKKYSLDDADISDRTNASAAFAFLTEMERRKDSEKKTHTKHDAMDTDDCSSKKIQFKKQIGSKELRKPSFNNSVTLRRAIECDDVGQETSEKAILKGSKVVMPEYVIGQKLTNKKKRKFNTSESTESNEVEKKSDKHNRPHLQHLFDEEEEIDD